MGIEYEENNDNIDMDNDVIESQTGLEDHPAFCTCTHCQNLWELVQQENQRKREIADSYYSDDHPEGWQVAG